MTQESVSRFFKDAHIKYILGLDSDQAKETFAYWATEHLRMSGVYWALSAMSLLGTMQLLDREEIIKFVLDCRKECGGFAGNVHHDAHLLYTLSAIQILVMLDALDHLKDLKDTEDGKDGVEKVVDFISQLQLEDGSFMGDEWREVDSRFVYCALNCLSLLHRLEAINVSKALDWILECQNFDGAFGSVPQAESHAAFCCVAALAIGGRLDDLDANLLGWWLAERQVPAGGLNGRPEKLPDVCYSWWVSSGLIIINKFHWVQQEKLKNWILSCQDEETGGFADRPGDLVDIFHTFFGIAGLNFLKFEDLIDIDPAYALPVSVLDRLGLAHPWQKSR